MTTTQPNRTRTRVRSTPRRRRVADLNATLDPAELVHMFNQPEVEAAFFDGRHPVALCGYVLARVPEAREATRVDGATCPPEALECPYCHVLNTRRHGLWSR